MLKALILVLLLTSYSFADVRSICLVRLSPTLSDAGGSGTGFFIADDIVMTNHHVIDSRKDAEGGIRIEYNNRLYPAKYLRSLPDIDVAILKLNQKIGKPLTLAKKNPKNGDKISIFGHPWAVWKVHLSEGKVLQGYDVKKGQSDLLYTMYETDASTMDGMSGSPAISNGKVVGLVFGRQPEGTNGYFTAIEDINKFLETGD